MTSLRMRQVYNIPKRSLSSWNPSFATWVRLEASRLEYLVPTILHGKGDIEQHIHSMTFQHPTPLGLV